MIPNGHITIYNKYTVALGRAEAYQRAEVKNVVWQSTKAVSRMREQTAANTALILIPFSVGTDYQEPKAWKVDREGWTLQEGDIIVRGIVTDEIGAGYTVSDLKADHESVVQIASVDAMDQGSPNIQHWEVTAK